MNKEKQQFFTLLLVVTILVTIQLINFIGDWKINDKFEKFKDLQNSNWEVQNQTTNMTNITFEKLIDLVAELHDMGEYADGSEED